MKYFVSAEDETVQEKYEDKIRGYGQEVVEGPEDAVLVSLGGDGSILYNVSVHEDFEAVLPVRIGDSEGNKCKVNETEFEEAIEALENDEYVRRTEQKLSAFDQYGDELTEDFSALSEIGFHHTQPNESALFSYQIKDPELGFSYEKQVQGDSIITSTPFGSTGYYNTITHDSFEEGLGVSFNNVIEDKGTEGIVLTEQAQIKFNIQNHEHKSNAKLFPDLANNDKPELRDPYQPETGQQITVRFTDEFVDFLDPLLED